MSDTQESSVGCFSGCSWFKCGRNGRRPAGQLELIPLVSVSHNETSSKSTALSATKTLLRVTAFGLQFVPIPHLDQIPSTILKCIEIYESIGGNDKNLEELRDVIQKAQDSIFRPLKLYPGAIPDEIKTITEGLFSDVNRQLESIKSQQRSLVSKVISTDDIAEEINQLRTHIQGAITNFNTSAITLNLSHTIRLSIDYDLSKLRKAEAQYTAVKSKSKCHPNTRVSTQESILNHLRRPENRFIWLRGSPGTGKTAISMSVASVLKQEGVLAASFFWDKNQGSGLNSPDWFPSTLARQLANFSREYQSVLVRRLRDPSLSDVGGFPLESQMKVLILEPMDELKELWSSVDNRPVIVLDGLDECGDFEALNRLMKLVLMLDELPGTFVVLVSCRPESEVIYAWEGASHEIPREDLNVLPEDDHLQTVRRIVEEGLKESVERSSWKPSSEEYDAFARTCRELPVLATIRVRDVSYHANHGSTLKIEFQSFSNIKSAPKDLNAEYLRILRRAFMSESTNISQRVVSNYRQVIGTIVAAQKELSVDTMSHFLEKTREEIRGTLKPISSIVDLPSDNAEQVKFYHATAMEFITGKPKGKRKDKIFFLKDTKGYFLGLYLLRFLNNTLEQFNMPTDRPLGDRNKWDEFMRERPWILPHIRYATEYLFYHLNPSQLSGELRSEFGRFLNGNLLSFLILYPYRGINFPDNIARIGSKLDILGLTKEAKNVLSSKNVPNSHFTELNSMRQDTIGPFTPWHVYRSFLPFSPPSSIIHKLYAHLSDPITIFSVSAEFTGHSIPLSEDAQRVVEARIRNSGFRPDYEAELPNDDIRGGIVTCSALSQDGKYVALGFGNGAIEISDIDHSRTISQFWCEPSNLHPVWIEFIHGDCRITVEDNRGNITIFAIGSTPIKLDQLPTGPYPPVTMVSRDESMILRAPRSIRNGWYNDMRIIYVPEDPSIHRLTPPTSFALSMVLSFAPSIQHRQPFLKGQEALPRRRSIGFSPGGWYIVALDLDHAFIWSTESRALISHYRVSDFTRWMLNTCDDLPHSPDSYLIPIPIFHERPDRSHDTSLERSRRPDEEWLDHPFLDLTPSMTSPEMRDYSIYSSIIGKVPILSRPSSSGWPTLWFDGRAELTIPAEYKPLIVPESDNYKAWYGDRVLDDVFFLPRSSKDGARILLQGKTKAPIIVDISQVV